MAGHLSVKPEDWAAAVFKTIKEVVSKSGADKDEVKGIGISGQMHGLVALDKDGNPLGSAILHCDTRGQCVISDFQEKIGKEIVEKQLLNPPYLGFLAITL